MARPHARRALTPSTEITKAVLAEGPPVSDTERFTRSPLSELPFYYGWLIIVICFVCSTVTFGTIYSFSVFLDPILSEFGRSYANTSVIFSVQSVVTFGSGAALGITIDRYGVRRLMVVGCGLVVAGLLSASVSTSFWAVGLAYGVVVAAGLGVVFVISYATPARWFTRRRGLATAIATAGAGVGIVVIPPAVSALLPVVGWRGAYASLAGLFILVLGLALLVLADRPRDVAGASTGRVDEPASSADMVLSEQVRAVWRVSRSVSFLLVFLGLIFSFAPAYVMLVHVVEHAQVVGLSRDAGVLAVSVLGGMNVVGKFLIGPLADRVGSAQALAVCAVCTGTSAFSATVVASPRALLVVAALMGIGFGGVGALIATVIAELFGTLNINALFGLVSLSFAITGSLAPYTAAYLYDALGSFVPAFVGGGALSGVAVGVFVSVAYLSD